MEEMEKQEASKTTQSVPKSLTKVEERKAHKRSGTNAEEKKATEKKKVSLTFFFYAKYVKTN